MGPSRGGAGRRDGDVVIDYAATCRARDVVVRSMPSPAVPVLPDDSDGDAGNATGTVTATGRHPFWVDSRHRWLDASAVRAGDRLRTPQGDLKEALGTRAWTENRSAYNLTVPRCAMADSAGTTVSAASP